MGLTIHYGLRSDAISPEQARQQVKQLRQAALDVAMSEVGEIAESSGAACDFQTAEDASSRWLLVQARRLVAVGKTYCLLVPIRVFAFSAWPGEECEVANLGLDRHALLVRVADQLRHAAPECLRLGLRVIRHDLAEPGVDRLTNPRVIRALVEDQPARHAGRFRRGQSERAIPA